MQKTYYFLCVLTHAFFMLADGNFISKENNDLDSKRNTDPESARRVRSAPDSGLCKPTKDPEILFHKQVVSYTFTLIYATYITNSILIASFISLC